MAKKSTKVKKSAVATKVAGKSKEVIKKATGKDKSKGKYVVC